MKRILYEGEFFGQTLKSCEVAGLSLTETTHGPNIKLPRHAHSHAYFCIALQGTYTEVYEKKIRECHALTLAFHPPFELHSEQFRDLIVRSFNVEMKPCFLERIREHSPILDSPADFQGGLTAMLGIRAYNEFQRMDGASPLVIEGLILEMIAEASRLRLNISSRKSDYWLSQVKEMLHAHFSENLALSSIAQKVNVHPVHLAREFRKLYRCSIGEYVRQLRIEFACKELASTDAPLIEIALRAGFFDQSHFCRVFKRSMGLTPAQYRLINLPAKGPAIDPAHKAMRD